MVKEMELTLENLVNEIVEKEYRCYLNMLCAKRLDGSDSFYFNYWNSRRSILYTIANKFGFVDKLKR